ncbi:ABC transporter ATP-binding protein [Deinococcus peraridilitoris]|uniref:ABC-type spermidine/putrescine transport system, ATPase component n=1 Tax=Deinococcus peraridilitoris (strain DSM 19664 / LMG 22246 / CIP 109416 / KR-200) TaxID=937777 RepID=K9ZZG1_DEIPD|nr:ABC transporter ATP-binding protein [Deinococcus peraridilitoris]AFZ66322.1 ABC-type spermidine/putrescine transport system, ATPase component [Deinococcus peraridilitoris DSM 19664]
MTAVLELRGVSKSFGRGLPCVLTDVNLSVQEGELLTLLGPSGCGKTTLLRLVAGFEQPDVGEVRVAGERVAGEGAYVAPEQRGVGMVFQEYALFPHLSVLQNVMFGLRGRDRRERAREVLAMVGLTVFEQRFPHQLSGGQQQRVALARALAPKPRLLLLDEPFSNLDAALRHATRAEMHSILREANMTAVLVTHDQEEALAFSDRLAVLRGGIIEQLGAPDDVYRTPRSAFVASFLGRSNLLSGTAHGAHAETALGEVPLPEPLRGPVMLSLRPEDFRLGEGGVPVSIVSREYKGHDVTYTVQLSGLPRSAGSLHPLELLVQGPSFPLLTHGEHTTLRLVGPAQVVRQ